MIKRVKILSVSVLAAVCLAALPGNAPAKESVNLGAVTVKSTAIKTDVTNVSGEDLVSGDLANALENAVPSISIIRRSGIANDIILRGQRKDNINVLIDGGKIYGACPNRMDPPTSHVITSNIKNVEIIEGPYDVEDFGSLSGTVKITTKKPSKKLKAVVNANAGSWDYRKASAFASGGAKAVRILLGGSVENSDQYKDGNGDTMAQQLKLATEHSTNPKIKGTQYLNSEFDRKAYLKKSLLGKVYVDVTNNQELGFSTTFNRSSNVLYPSTPMDAIKDNSNLYNIHYTFKNLGKYSDKLKFEYYYSYVHHIMTNEYRKMRLGKNGTIAHIIDSRIFGFKAQNRFHIGKTTLAYGADVSKRNWNGRYWKKYYSAHIGLNDSMPDVNTVNFGFFTKGKRKFGKLELEAGARYDHTKITTNNSDPSETYNDISGYVFTYYNITPSLKYFVGAGKSIRVPDAKESHYRLKDLTATTDGKLVGNPNIKEVKNYEADTGIEGHFSNAMFKVKVFYSLLRDYIVYNARKVQYQNVNAKIYGYELSGTYFVTDNFYFNGGVSYQRGKKDSPLAGETDKDLPSIPPIKTNIAANYDYRSLSFKTELVAAGRWSKYDSDNGEQAIPGWAVVNCKLTGKNILNKFNLTVGVDNIFDKNYAVSNTYKDLTLVSGSTGEVMLLNEPGRYIYANLSFVF